MMLSSSTTSRLTRQSAPSFVRRAYHRARRPHPHSHIPIILRNTRPFSDLPPATTGPQTSLAIKSTANYNEIGIQHLTSHLHNQIFLKPSPPPPPDLVELSKQHLRRHDLLGKNTDNNEPVSFDLPPLQGDSLDQHFHNLGVDCAEPFLSMAKKFADSKLPPKPKKWIHQSGWTKYYHDGTTKPQKVAAPDEDMLSFDVEVMWKVSPFAVMACAAGPNAWYAWLSPWLLGEDESDRHLIPLGDPKKARVIAGHNIGYDRARILEEYSLKQTRNAFLDTMSLHVAVNGMCSQQRPTWMKFNKPRKPPTKAEAQSMSDNDVLFESEPELWVEKSAINSLRDVAHFHLGVVLDKTTRDDFTVLDRQDIMVKLDTLLDYCAEDVAVTHRVYKVVFPNFLQVCPHPVSFAALRHLSTVILPVNKSWDAYIANSEATYRRLSDAVQERLLALTEKAMVLKDEPEKWQNDPWLMQLNWSGQEIRMVKGKGKDAPPRPAARQKLPGTPKWYKDLSPKLDSGINITVRTRISSLLLRLRWEGYPVFWSNIHGWTFRVPVSDVAKYAARQVAPCDMKEETIEILKDNKDFKFYKLPHKDGPLARCATPLAKAYLPYFERGTLSSEFELAKEALEMNASCSYWISARARIMSQMVVYEKDIDTAASSSSEGFILPQVIPMGTVTRRAVEKTWLTASNAKKNRVGSELKAMVQAPPGYTFVGADVDSEELWIASLVGDATFKMHGGNAIGFMTLEGTKAAGTDMHSRTASILGITRNDAKIFNYGRIYGAGLKFASMLLRQFNHTLSEEETANIATRLYISTKGQKVSRKAFSPRPFWRGGTESFVFNKLEEFAEQKLPRTPVLGAGITEALMGRHVKKGGFLTSRINWAIQSSGVDYLHLLIISMDYLTRRYAIDARLAITVHDEIRYLVKDCDKYRAAMALQVSNIWTRAMFSEQVGINGLPQACAFFSAVDIDSVFRKEVDLDCVTPSHPNPIPAGESYDIYQLLAKGEEARLDPNIVPSPSTAPKFDDILYTPRTPVMSNLDNIGAGSTNKSRLDFVKAQIVNEDEKLKTPQRQQRVREVTPRVKPSDRNANENKNNKDDKDNDTGVMPVHKPILIRDSVQSSLTPLKAGAAPSQHPPANVPSVKPAPTPELKKPQRRSGGWAPVGPGY